VTPASKAARIAPNRGLTHPFDKKYGTDTSGYLTPEDLVTGRDHDSLNYGYSAIAPSVFREACRRWQANLPAVAGRIEAYSFVDVGAGKGRAVLLAAELPFRKIVGIELNPHLAKIAQHNVERWRRVGRSQSDERIRMIQADALEFRWPRHPLLVYLYNPFECSLVAKLMEKLAASCRSASPLVDLLYMNPTCTDTLSAQGLFSHLWTVRIPMDKADAEADPYGTDSDLVSACVPQCSARLSFQAGIVLGSVPTIIFESCGYSCGVPT
jgi:SAM-dependent methyltransferase